MAHRIQAVLESNYLVPVEYVRRMQQCADAVCRVVNNTGTLGTGFLIGRQLIITNNHILSTAESCTYVPATESTPAKGVAQFFYEAGKKTIEVPLDGKSIFITSPTPGNQSANGNSLDFTIVALAPVPETDDLSRIYALPLSLFKDVVTPAKDDEAVMIQHPNGDKTQVSWGSTRVITHDNVNVHYNTKAAKGSSGSPVLNKERRLFALHRLGNCPEHTLLSCNQGVLINAVVAFLNTMKNPQDPQKTGIEAIQEWLDDKNLPLTEMARRLWNDSKPWIDQAQKYFEVGRQEPFSRKRAYKYLSDAYRSLTEALKLYKTPQAANQKADKHKIEQQRNFVRWQKMVVALELAIPRFLPHAKDKSHPMLYLLRNHKEPLLTLDDWLKWEQQEIVDSKLEPDPATCFLIAFVAEEFFDNEKVTENDEKSSKIKLSAKWYVSLAKSYHDRGENIFLKRACLDKALELDPSIKSDKKYDALDKTFKIRETRVQVAFADALKKLDSQPRSSKPSCFIFHDWEPMTMEWIEHYFHPHLQMVRAKPLYAKKKICDDEMVHFICNEIRDSKYVLILCTPSLVEKEEQAFAANKPANLPEDIKCVRFAFQMLRKFRDIGASDSNLLRLIQDGDSQESIPSTFADRESFLFNPTYKYYENILRLFGMIKAPPKSGGEHVSPVPIQDSVDRSDSDGGGGDIQVEKLISDLNMIDLGAERMEALAASGDPEANFHLAQCYSFGHKYGTASYDVNLDKAVDLYKKASSLEDGRAEVRLGQILTYHQGNPREALEWFVKAEQKGNLQALIEQEKYYSKKTEIHNLAQAEMLRLRIEEKIAVINGRSRIANTTKETLIFEYNQELANNGDLLGMIGLAWCYNNGCGVPQNHEKATEWQRVIDRLKKEQAKDQPPAVEGQVSRTNMPRFAEHQPKPAASAAVQQVSAQPSAVEIQLRIAHSPGHAKNQPKPAALAKNQLQRHHN